VTLCVLLKQSASWASTSDGPTRLALVAPRPPAYACRMSEFKRTERTQVKRLPDRGAYDTETVFPILDEGLICHVGFSVEGQPFVIPTGYARVGDTLYIHGSAASRMLRTLAEGIQVCVTVTLLDGLVLARAAFHHSMNYRSVVILGRATLVEDRAEKIKALEAFTEHIVRGRWNDVRLPTETELKATTVLALPLAEVSAKVRSGPPKDDAEDYQLPIWAGVVPLTIIPGAPITDPRLIAGIEAPAYAKKYSR
jgi:nitroimidazol reductase NimA-like FMN-containing flavoprotein (pyridoxamine 5'-phosphate oxidase superfamily)